MSDNSKEHWLVRPESIRKLWIGFSIVLALTVVAQFGLKIKGYFVVDAWFGFAAGFGFLSCLLMVLFAKFVGLFLKRDENYYREGDSDD